MLSQHEKRLFTKHEEAREFQEVGLSAQADVACEYCEVELEEEQAHVIGGESFCSGCALDEVTRLRTSATWSSLSPGQRLEAFEVLGAAANRMEEELRASIRAGRIQ